MNKYYIIKFSSIKSCNEYMLSINTSTGYYHIYSIYGNIKYEGYYLIDCKQCNALELNNLASNAIDSYYKMTTKVYGSNGLIHDLYKMP